jgi:hypothetical protein
MGQEFNEKVFPIHILSILHPGHMNRPYTGTMVKTKNPETNFLGCSYNIIEWSFERLNQMKAIGSKFDISRVKCSQEGTSLGKGEGTTTTTTTTTTTVGGLFSPWPIEQRNVLGG